MPTLNKNAPIGFFDSGVGGLTVLKQVKKLLPNESFIFFGDTLHVPYGEKTKAQLLSYSKNILNFFDKKNVKAVVMACNTTSSLIYDDIKDKYKFKIYPLVQSCAKLFSSLEVNTLGIFATKATINSKTYEKVIHNYNKNMRVIGQFCPDWVKIVENNLSNLPEYQSIIQKDIEKMLKTNPDKIILGCTHYPYLNNILCQFAPKELFIDPSITFAQYIKDDLILNNLITDMNNNTEEYYVSSNPEKFVNSSKMFYELKQSPQLVVFK